jgi:C-mannosyltransferase DPY19L
MVKNLNIKKEREVEKKENSHNNFIICAFFSLLFGYLHTQHVSALFENRFFFSHLSNLERELSFRTEAGLYYYYFKILTADDQREKASLIQLIHKNLINDNRTEHPKTINSLKRFNLYPEVVLASLYHVAKHFNLLDKKQCYKINRGQVDNESKLILSCVGNSEPFYFYTQMIFNLQGLSLAAFFVLCWLINDKSIVSGIIGCLCYFYNHSEATRVMWIPALRENFSFPFHVTQLVNLILNLFIRLHIVLPNLKIPNFFSFFIYYPVRTFHY